jgi:hypothetical protein
MSLFWGGSDCVRAQVADRKGACTDMRRTIFKAELPRTDAMVQAIL